jgi:hypothetical protein
LIEYVKVNTDNIIYLTGPHSVALKINELVDEVNRLTEQLAFLRAKLEGQDEKFENHYHLIKKDSLDRLSISLPRDVNG